MVYYTGLVVALGLLQLGLCDVTDPCPFWTGGSHADGKCYKAFVSHVNYSDAQSLCEQQGSGIHLAEILTEQQNTTIISILRSLKDDNISQFWLGIKYNSQISNFEWVQAGKVLDNKFVQWKEGEPDNATLAEECVILLKSGMMDVPCTKSIVARAQVCQRDARPATNPCYFWEGATYVNGKCFRSLSSVSTWSEAQELCGQETPAGTLAEISTDQERSVVSDMLLQMQSNEVWLGYSDLVTENTFLWASTNSGSPAPDVTWWMSGYPSRGNSNAHCVTMISDSRSGKMRTVDCSTRKNVICQRTANNPCELLMSDKAEYFQGRCFLFVDEKKTWIDAQYDCIQRSGYLTEPNTAELQTYVIDLAGRNKGESVWVGSYNKQGELKWEYTGDVFKDRPAPLVDGCGLQVRGQVRSWTCSPTSNQGSFICEKDIGDPCETFLPGSAYSSGQCFKYFDDPRSWESARQSCLQKDAFLAEPKTSELSDAVNTYLQSRPASTVWIGGTLKKANTLQWDTNGQNLNYSLLTEATSGYLEEGYLAVQNGVYWTVEDKNDVYPFICQRGVETGINPRRSVVALFPKQQNVNDLEGYVQITGTSLSYLVILAISRFINTQQQGTTVTFLQPKTVFSYKFDPQQLMTSEGLHSSYIEVISSSPVTTVLYIRSSNRLAASTLLLPGDLFMNYGTGLSYFLVSACKNKCTGNVVTATSFNGPSEVSVLFPRSSSPSRLLAVGDITYSQFTSVTATIPSRHGSVYFSTNIDFDGSYLTSKDKIAVLIGGSGAPTANGPDDFMLDQILPVQFTDKHYITFPSLQPGLTDFVKVVAVESNTIVEVYNSNNDNGSRQVYLEKAGDVVEVQLLNEGFYHLGGNLAFYAFRYSKNGLGHAMCLTSLFPFGLWKHQYHFQTPPELTGYRFSLAVIVSRQYTSDITLGDSDIAKSCSNISGTELAGCTYTLPWSNRTFYHLHLRNFNERLGAYLIASTSTSMLCHSLGVRNNPQPTYTFNSEASRRSFSDPPECDASTTTTIWDTSTTNTICDTSTTTTICDTSTTTTISDTTTDSLEVNSLGGSTSEETFNPAVSTDPTSSSSSRTTTRTQHFSFNSENFVLNTKKTSAYRRSKTSIPDYRVSSVTIGSGGVICLVVIFGALVIGDILRLCKFIDDFLQRRKSQYVSYAK